MKILGTGSALPKKVVTNDDLAAFLDTNDEWISTRTGIRERRVLSHETLQSLAERAGQAALENAGVISVEALSGMTDEQLLAIRGIGPKKLEQIRRALAERRRSRR